MTPRAEPSSPARASLSGNALAVLSMLAWAVGFPAAEVLLDTWDPLAMVFGRFVMALAFLLPLWWLFDGPARARHEAWGRGMWVGALGFGGGAWSMLIAQWYTDPVTTAIIAAATPLAATLVSWWYDRQPLTRGFSLGLAATLVGGLVATGVASGQPLPSDLGPGAAMAVASAILFSWGSHHVVRDLPEADALTRTVISSIGATVFILIAYVAFLVTGLSALPPTPFTAIDLGLLALYGLMAFGVSQLAWIAAADRLGIAIAAFHINIAPFYVMLILVALGGAWSWHQAIGAAIVGAGVILAQRGDTRSRASSGDAPDPRPNPSAKG